MRNRVVGSFFRVVGVLWCKEFSGQVLESESLDKISTIQLLYK